MKRVLVTGATGFIGKACIEILLEDGQYEIHAASNTSKGLDHDMLFQHQLDLHDHQKTRNLVNIIKPTHLLHLAWYAVPGKFWASDENYKWVDTSVNLLRSFSSSGGERCVTAGSCAEYIWNDTTCHEDTTPLDPATIYGECKKTLYTIQKDFCRDTGLSCAWGRVFHLYGPHEPEEKLISSIIKSLLNGHTAECLHGDLVRDYLYVKDVASAFVALLASDIEGAVNIASGQPISLREIILTIADKLDARKLVHFGNKPPTANEPATLTGNVEKIRDDVGWQPAHNLDAGIDLTINWWQQQTGRKQGK